MKNEKFSKGKRGPMSWVLYILVMGAALITFCALLFLIVYILWNGIPHINPSLFVWEYNSENVSLMPALINTLLITVVTLIVAVPIGIGSAIYMVEYAKKGNKIVRVVRITAETLSGIPSIVYGLFGMLFFVTTLRLRLSLLAGALTLAIMILPLIMRTTEEALKSVPDSYREGSFGLGAGRVRTIFRIVLPAAVPGILSGIILAIGRIVGETAALMYTAGTVTEVVSGKGLSWLMDSGRTLAYHMYALSSEGFHTDEAYATAVVLLVIVMIINWISNRIAKKITKV